MQSERSADTEPTCVVDASVWISTVLPDDRFHAISKAWLADQTSPTRGVHLPTFALVEIGGAIARISNNASRARAVLAQIEQIHALRLHDLDAALANEARDIAIDLRLRGADSVYVTLAARLNVPLVTWDNEVLDRAASRITVFTPAHTV